MSKTILLNTGWTFTKEGHGEPVALPHTWNAVDGQDGGNDYYLHLYPHAGKAGAARRRARGSAV